MAPRRRNAPVVGPASDERRYNVPDLDFDEPLTWPAGKPIAVADLLKRLQTLATKLRNYDVDQPDSQAFTTLAHDLANPNLLGHKDKGVRASTVACVVDVLKLCAPEAPFVTAQLKVRHPSVELAHCL
jgi:sister chromatid cohesion protein PDS5